MYQLLFVDDEAIIREGVSENVAWETLGYQLAGVCENGIEAKDFLQKQPVDVVITDICMPFMDGVELSAYIQKEYPETKVLILSGYDDFDYAKKAIKYGVEEYLLKPLTSCELSDILAELKGKLDEEYARRKKQEEIYTTYRKGQQLLYSEALLHTITGSKPEKECKKELEAMGISLKGSHYLVGVAGLSIYADTQELNETRRKESALMAFIVYNLCQEIMKQHQGGQVCQGIDNRVFLLFVAECCEEAEEKIKRICEEIIAKVNEVMGLSVNIALGSWQEHFAAIYRSYEEAEDALCRQYTAGTDCVIDSRGFLPGNELEGKLEMVADNSIRHVRENERKKLEEDRELLEQLLRQSHSGRQEVLRVLERIKERLDKLLDTLGVPVDAGNFQEELWQASSLPEAMEVLYAYELRVCGQIEQTFGRSNKSCAYQAYEYIETHYSDSTLNLQEVCSHLGVSTSWFSNLFKQTFHSTFMDVVIGIRMEKARELLAMTDLKNYEIAEKVGFSDPHYFSIAFKKVTGKTPTEYAKERKKGSSV